MTEAEQGPVGPSSPLSPAPSSIDTPDDAEDMVLDTNDQPGQISYNDHYKIDQVRDENTAALTTGPTKISCTTLEQRRFQRVERMCRVMKKRGMTPGYFLQILPGR